MRAERATRIYVGALLLTAIALGIYGAPRVSDLADVGCFAVLFLAAARFKARVSNSAIVSLTPVVAIATYPVLGLGGCLAAFSGLATILRSAPLIKTTYNVAQSVICTFGAGLVYLALGGPVRDLSAQSFPLILLPVSAAIVVWHLINVVLLGAVLWIGEGVRPPEMLDTVARKAFGPFLGYSYLGLLMAILWLGRLGPFAALFMLAPLFAAHWAFSQHSAEQRAHQATLSALAQAIETKDAYTRGHGERVSRAARALGAGLGWTGDRLQALAQAGLLHDVGKIGVPTRILTKDGRLTEEEFASIKLHPLHGVEVVGDIGFLEDARAGIMHHHERYDGRGYPSGLRGSDIPEFGRALSIADAFDCMTSLRSYRPARPVHDALQELIACKGSQFDPHMVDVFVAAIRRQGWIPATPPSLPTDAPVSSYDHDDPTAPPPVDSARGDLA